MSNVKIELLFEITKEEYDEYAETCYTRDFELGQLSDELTTRVLEEKSEVFNSVKDNIEDIIIDYYAARVEVTVFLVMSVEELMQNETFSQQFREEIIADNSLLHKLLDNKAAVSVFLFIFRKILKKMFASAVGGPVGVVITAGLVATDIASIVNMLVPRNKQPRRVSDDSSV